MSRDEQIEEAPKITKIYETIEVTDEMRKLADEMQKAISDEYRRRVLADERALEAVLKENGWRKSYDVALEAVDDFQRRLRHIFLDMCNGNDYDTLNLLQIDSAIEALYDAFVAELKKK